MRLANLLAVALAEMRSARRLARTWIFAVIAVLIAVIAYGYFAVIHGLASGFSATAGFIGPRFLISAMGFYLLWLMMVAMIFLAFDVRARDVRERIVEVLDSRPVTNLELVAGRLLGLVFVAWVPVLVMAVLVQGFGLFAANSAWFGQPLQEASLASFVFVEMLPSLLLWGSVVMLLTVLLRNRLLVAVVALALVAVPMVVLFSTPTYLSAITTFVALPSYLASDMVSTSFTAAALAHRFAMLALAVGFVFLAAALHPRRDGAARGIQLSAGGAGVVLGLTVFGVLVAGAVADLDRRLGWGQAHAAHRGEPASDLRSVTGSVIIDPGESVSVDLDLALTAPALAAGELLFSLNPGLAIGELRLDSIEAAYRHDRGLLIVTPPRPLAPGAEYTLTVRATGAPEAQFGYLDNVVEPLLLKGNDNQLLLLGTDAAVFTSRHVALMPAARWMPYPGANIEPAPGDPARHDYFDLDIEVALPAGWLVAGPGLREALSDTRYRFRPPAPVPAFGLVAGRFERRAVEVTGVTVELLLHPGHTGNLEVFEEAGDALVERLGEMFAEAAALGLPYPYRGLSLVEAPITLRSFGGGWRMDTVMSLPGLLLMRETSWPTSRFEFQFRDRQELELADGGVAGSKVHVLMRFFENDLSGGNVVLGAARNFLAFQTGATGAGAEALDFVAETLAARLLTGGDGYFSAHVFASADNFGAVIGATVTNIFSVDGGDSIVDTVTNAASNRPSVWDTALGASLAELDPWDDPAMALNVITLKGRAVASAIMDGLGRERTARLLAELRTRHGGGTYTPEDFEAAAAAVDADVAPIVGDWLRDAALAGFIASAPEVFRLPDGELGEARYQIRLALRNGEAAAGLVRLRYTTPLSVERGDGAQAAWIDGEPIRVPGNSTVEVGLIANGVPQQLVMEPYLSLNRGPVELDLPDIDEETIVEAEPFLGTAPGDWLPAAARDIVVDDLDDGFSVVSQAAEADEIRLGGLRIGVPDADIDQGLPVHQSFAPVAGWARQEAASAWGRYRHTVARTSSGEGNHVATFLTRLPSADRWRLDYHLPAMPPRGGLNAAAGRVIRIAVSTGTGPAFFGAQGTYNITLESNGSSRTVEFDASVGEPGWNDLGEFDLDAGEVRVSVTNASSGRTVVADAIRWRPARPARNGAR